MGSIYTVNTDTRRSGEIVTHVYNLLLLFIDKPHKTMICTQNNNDNFPLSVYNTNNIHYYKEKEKS